MPKPDKPLSILSFGAGAIGTYICGSLALHGHPVVFIERPEVANEIRQRGLHLALREIELAIPDPKIASTIEEALSLGDFDLAIFAVKSYDTQAALENMAPHASTLPPVLCLQNGVENETALESVLGQGKVIAGTVTSAIGRRAAGDIVLERRRGMGIAAGHALSAALVNEFNQAGLNARLYTDDVSMKWSKMISNLLGNATSAILDITPAEVFAHHRLYRLEIAQLRETFDVMAAQRIKPVNLPGVPINLLALVVRFFPTWASRPFLQKAVGGGRGAKMPSFHIDLHSGRGKSEVGYLNGAVVRSGARLGIPTPVNRMLNETLLKLTQGKLPVNSFTHQPEKLLFELTKYYPSGLSRK